MMQVVVALMLLTSGAFVPAQANPGNPLDDITNQVNSAIDGVGSFVNDVIGGVGNAISNAAKSAYRTVTPERSIPARGGGSGYGDERKEVKNITDFYEDLANNHPEKWQWYKPDGVPEKVKVVNVAVTKDGKIIANHSVKINWSNKSLNITKGLAKNADMKVYPKYGDVVFTRNVYRKVVNDNDTKQQYARFAKIWEKTPCEPKETCSFVRDQYWDLISGYHPFL